MVKTKIFFNKFNKKFTKGSVLAIGNFDSVHIGHQSIINKGKAIARKSKTKFGILTFEPSPKEFFSKNAEFRINSVFEKQKIFSDLNIDYVIFLKFNNKLRNLKPENFIQNILINKIKNKYLIVGKDFCFGKNRKGNTELLKKNKNFKVIIPKTEKLKNKKVSSSFIRKLIKNGKVEEVKKYLGHFWKIHEKIIQGKKIGKKLGFATANLILSKRLKPKIGVYAVYCLINNKKFKGIANFGFAPTFGRKKLVLEVHIFKTLKSLYSKKIFVEFVKFIRNEKKFKNNKALINQIRSDIDKAKNILKNVR